jgi:agmatine/peptidylarginine deiminase
MMKTERFPVTVSEEGVSAKIRKFTRIKNGQTYTTFAAEYFLLGKHKQEWRSKFEDAKTAALEACRTISRGQQVLLPLVNGDRMEYLSNHNGSKVGVVQSHCANVFFCPRDQLLYSTIAFIFSALGRNTPQT